MCGVKDQAGHRSSPVFKLLHLRRASPLWEAPARSLLQRKDVQHSRPLPQPAQPCGVLIGWTEAYLLMSDHLCKTLGPQRLQLLQLPEGASTGAHSHGQAA